MIVTLGTLNPHPHKDLRHILRHDPDVVLIGEIRDAETAQIAFQASLTGHMVLSTLHTNDVPSTFVRLVDMGVEPYLVNAAVEGVAAQRLLRRICQTCHGSGESPTAPGERCETCFGGGHSGRVAIYEIMRMSDEIRKLSLSTADAGAIRQVAVSEGMKGMIDDGMERVRAGLTTETELHRVLA